MSSGIKHLIECHWILPQFKKRDNHVYHKFTVYSKIKDDSIIEKFSQCNNCGAIHKIYDFCKSEIMIGKEDYPTGLTIEEMSLQLSDKLNKVLNINSCDRATWEHVIDIIDNERWEEPVVIKRDIIDSKQVIKILSIKSEDKIKIHSKTIEDEIIGEGRL